MINIAENKDALKSHIIHFQSALEYYKKAYPNEGIEQYAVIYLDNEIAMEKGMNEYYNGLIKIHAYNQRILRAIKSVKGNTFYKHLIELIKDAETTDYQEWEIVSKPVGKCQEVTECGRSIRKEWVDQRAVGDSGDSWAGSICIQLKENKYLKFYFSM